MLDWGNSFEGKNVHEQVHFFNKTIVNIFHYYIPNKTILCNDKDPPWFNNEVGRILTKKNEIFKHYIASGKSHRVATLFEKNFFRIFKRFHQITG